VQDRARLAQSHLTVLSGEPDFDLRTIGELVGDCTVVDGRADLEAMLSALLVASETAPITIAPKTLDLVGHTRTADAMLTLGDWMVDAANPTVTVFFRGLAEHDVLPRLGIHTVRLLGCRTADSARGRATICALAEILGVEVEGTTAMLSPSHYRDGGFRDEWQFLLVGATDLQRAPAEVAVGEPNHRCLDIDALPAIELAGERSWLWPVRIATPSIGREILQLVQRDRGAYSAGVSALPDCELALPTTHGYHIAEVVLGGHFLRFHPDGDGAPGILYPVEDPTALRRLLELLPSLTRR
jgi:hypothetical protein